MDGSSGAALERCVIAGGGPVGLFLACCLQYHGVPCRVLERRSKPCGDSRAIGIHPVALELLARLGLEADFAARGSRIEEGRAYLDGRYAGSIRFADGGGAHGYVLALPQTVTEALLERHLERVAPGTLRRGAAVVGLRQTGGGVNVDVAIDGRRREIGCEFLVGCDGVHSTVRRAAGIGFTGVTGRDCYAMGDFADPAGPAHAAAFYLHRAGLVESFPLPEARRRWVVKTDGLVSGDVRGRIVAIVRDRVGRDLAGSAADGVAAFRANEWLARQFVAGRVVVAGDAAHVVSPVGGYGMNLGWLDAWRLAALLADARGTATGALLAAYDRERRKIARQVQRRARFNMLLGRRRRREWLRNGLVRLIVGTPLRRALARLFAMRGLEPGRL